MKESDGSQGWSALVRFPTGWFMVVPYRTGLERYQLRIMPVTGETRTILRRIALLDRLILQAY